MSNKKISDIQFARIAGFPYWDRVSPKQALLAKFVKRMSLGKILLLGCGNGALAVFLSCQKPKNRLFLYSIDSLALKATKKTLQLHNITNAKIIPEVNLLPNYKETFDSVLLAIEFSRGRDFYRRMLLETYDVLKNNGQIYLAGANKSGIKTAIKDAGKLFNKIEILGYKAGNRITKGTKNPQRKRKQVWMEEKGIKPNSWCELSVNIANKNYSFYTLPGIFSYNKLDEGTRFLLENIRGFSNKKILDWGCGYGAIGIYLAKMGAKHVDMIDVNRFAVEAAKKNIIEGKINNASVFSTTDNYFDKKSKYDLVVSNPPFHIGKKVNYQTVNRFFKEAKEGLNNNGKLVIVANQFIPYEEWLKKYFSRTQVISRNKKYKVVEAN